MAWDTTLVLITRNLINDKSSAQAYSDERIMESILIGGLYATSDYPFSTDYTFDFDQIQLSPDPTVAATLDKIAMALFPLKAACILNTNSYQGSVGTAIKIRDGDSSVDTTGSFAGYDSILKNGPCGSYATLVKQLYMRGSAGATGRAVTTPQSLQGFYGTGIWNARDLYNSFIGW